MSSSKCVYPNDNVLPYTRATTASRMIYGCQDSSQILCRSEFDVFKSDCQDSTQRLSHCLDSSAFMIINHPKITKPLCGVSPRHHERSEGSHGSRRRDPSLHFVPLRMTYGAKPRDCQPLVWF